LKTKKSSKLNRDYILNKNLLILNEKYPNAIFTADSALYYHNLIDMIPQSYFLATYRKATKIMNNNVK